MVSVKIPQELVKMYQLGPGLTVRGQVSCRGPTSCWLEPCPATQCSSLLEREGPRQVTAPAGHKACCQGDYLSLREKGQGLAERSMMGSWLSWQFPLR